MAILTSWAGLLVWLPDQVGLYDGLVAALVPWPGFLEGETGGYAEHLGKAEYLLAFMGWMVEQAPFPVWPIDCGSKSGRTTN